MRWRTAFLILWAALAAIPAAAQGSDGQETAYRLLQSRQIMPLSEILAAIRPRLSGDIVEIDIHKTDGVTSYEIFFIDPGGQRGSIHVDPRSAAIIAPGE